MLVSEDLLWESNNNNRVEETSSQITWSVLDTIVSNNDENDNDTFMMITMVMMRMIYI